MRILILDKFRGYVKRFRTSDPNGPEQLEMRIETPDAGIVRQDMKPAVSSAKNEVLDNGGSSQKSCGRQSARSGLCRA